MTLISLSTYRIESVTGNYNILDIYTINDINVVSLLGIPLMKLMILMWRLT